MTALEVVRHDQSEYIVKAEPSGGGKREAKDNPQISGLNNLEGWCMAVGITDTILGPIQFLLSFH